MTASGIRKGMPCSRWLRPRCENPCVLRTMRFESAGMNSRFCFLNTTLGRRLRAAYFSSIEPLNLRIPLALDYGLAVYPEDGELQEVLIRVADERLYQLKNGMRERTAAQT